MEATLADEFQRGADQYLQPNLVPWSRLEWLALMQHHGAPTRLMDWTSSPYVAAFFAVENALEESAVWMIGETTLNDGGLDVLREKAGITTAEMPQYSERLDLIDGIKQPGIFVLEPYYLNQRLIIQQGKFLIAGDPKIGFTENLVKMDGFNTGTHVFKVIIRADDYADVLDDLAKMNIGRASLFPGLDGFAQSLNVQARLSSMRPKAPVWSSYLNILPEWLGTIHEPDEQ